MPSAPPAPGLEFDGAAKAAASSRHALRSTDDAASWTEDAAMYRTAVYGGPVPYVANEIGGAQRPLRLYHQDAVNSSASRGRAAQGDAAGEATCTKYQNANRGLAPGVMVRPQSQLLLWSQKPQSVSWSRSWSRLQQASCIGTAAVPHSSPTI